MLPFAVGVAISPMPIVAMVLMLITPKARANGFTFIFGWIIGVAVAGAICLAVIGPSSTSDNGKPAGWTYWLKLALGVVLLLLAVRGWRARPGPGADTPMPKWMNALDRFTAVKAGGMAVLLSALNPKNLVFIIGGATVIAQANLSGSGQAVAWAVYTLIATISVAVPMVIYLVMGDRAAAILDGLKTWMARNNTAVMTVLLLIIAVKLVGDAISGLAS